MSVADENRGWAVTSSAALGGNRRCRVHTTRETIVNTAAKHVDAMFTPRVFTDASDYGVSGTIAGGTVILSGSILHLSCGMYYACWGKDKDNKEVAIRLTGPRGFHHLEASRSAHHRWDCDPYIALSTVLGASSGCRKVWS